MARGGCWTMLGIASWCAFAAHATAAPGRWTPYGPPPGALLDLAIGGTAVGTGLNAHPEFAERAAKKIAELPSREGTTLTGVEPGPRGYHWRVDQAATIQWVEALDGGDLKNKVPFRDKVVALAAPFTGLIRWQSHWHVVRQSWAFFQNDFAGRISNRVMQTGPSVRSTLTATITTVWYILVYGASAIALTAAADRWLWCA